MSISQKLKFGRKHLVNRGTSDILKVEMYFNQYNSSGFHSEPAFFFFFLF